MSTRFRQVLERLFAAVPVARRERDCLLGVGVVNQSEQFELTDTLPEEFPPDRRERAVRPGVDEVLATLGVPEDGIRNTSWDLELYDHRSTPSRSLSAASHGSIRDSTAAE